MRLWIAILLIAVSANAATRIASVTGNWDNTATWGGAAVPVTGDTAQINGNIVVTVPAGVTGACYRVECGVSANSTGIATLDVEGTLNMDNTASGYIQLAQGSTKDAKLILGAGGVISNSIQMSLNNCYIVSTATRANPFKFIGGGTWANGFVSGPRQDIVFSNICFLDTGQHAGFQLLNTTGTATSRFIMTNCVGVGNNGWIIGAAATGSGVQIDVYGSDFYDFASIKAVTLLKASGGTINWIHNTMSQTISGANTLLLKPATTSSCNILDSVFFNGQVNTDTNCSCLISNCFFTSQLAVLNNGVGNTVTRNYMSPVIDNAGGINMIGATGSGTHVITYNVFEGQSGGINEYGVHYSNIPDFCLPAITPLAINLSYNLLIGGAELFIGHGAVTPPSFALGANIKNNTIAGKWQVDRAASGHIFGCEGGANPGTLNLVNNLHRGYYNVGEISIGGSSTGTNEVVTYSDYNNFYNVQFAYDTATNLVIASGNTGKTVPASHDLAVNPMFLDPSRDLVRWNFLFGSGVADSQQAGVNYFLGINGYRGTPNFDQGGTVSTKSTKDLLDWVRLGYLATNPLLHNAGDPNDGSPDIGIGYTNITSTSLQTGTTIPTVGQTSIPFVPPQL